MVPNTGMEGLPASAPDPKFRCSNPDLIFSDLNDEKYRVYEWPDGSIIKLSEPLKLNVSKSGGHRVFTADGISHYIPSGWIHLHWVVKSGQDHFKF